MPVYQIMGRNGKLYEIEGPPGVTKDQIKAKILARAPEAGLPQEEGFFSAMGRAVERGVPVVRKGLAQIVEDYPAIVSSVASGLVPGGGAMLRDLGAAASKSETYKELTGGLVAGERKAAEEQLAEIGPRKYQGFFDEQGVGRRLGSLAETVAESALPVGAGVATGLITRSPVAAGAVMGAGTVPMTYGGVRERQAVEGIDDVNRAVFGTTASSALDLLTGVGGRVLSGTAAAAARELLEAGLKQAAVRVAKSGAEEAGTETLQNVIEQVAGGTDPTTKQAMLETLEAGLAGALGGTVFSGASEVVTTPFRKQVAVGEGEEETSELDIPVTTGVDPEVTLGRLSEAAGPDISPAARIAVEALNRRVSNDLSLSTPESLGASRAFITAREDDIASGTFPEDIAGPYANALAEAKRMLEEVAPVTTQATADVEAAQTQAEPGGVAADILAPIKAAPNMAERKKVARPLVSNIVDELVGDVVVPSKVLTNITSVVSQEAAKPDAQFDLKARVGELLTKNGVEVVAAEPAERAKPIINEYVIDDAIDSNGPEQVRIVRRPDGAYIMRGEQLIDVSGQVEAGLSDKQIIASRILMRSGGANVRSVSAAPTPAPAPVSAPAPVDIPGASDSIARHEARGRRIAYMTPEEYHQAVGRPSPEAQRPGITDKLVRDIAENGLKEIPWIDLSGSGGQEGRHRMDALARLGYKKIPVAIVREAPTPEAAAPTPAPEPVAVEPAPEPVAVEPAPEPVAVEPVPPVPPTPPPTGGEPSAAIPEPTLPPQRAELQTPNKWLVKLADRFGMSAPLDAFVKANLGYESLPEALETTSKLELATTQQAGKVRNLQRNFFDPIVDTSANLNTDLGDLGFFLWARGAADRNRVVAEINPQEFPEGGSGLTTAQAAAGLQLLKDEGKLPKLNQLARKVDKLVDFNLEEDIKAGLLSREQANQLREAQPFYVPLKGFAKDGDMFTADVDEDADTTSRQQEAMRSLQTTMPTGSVREFRTAYGRGSVPFHPLFNLFQDSESRVRRRLVNTALLPTLRAYKQNPTAFEGILNVYSAANPKQVKMGRDIPGGRWEPVPNMEQEYYRNRDKYMMVKENGVPHYIEFAEQGPGAEVKRMFANMKSEDLKGAMKVMADINNFMKGMLTYKNPLYLLTVAPLRDTSAAIATALANQNIKTSPAYKKNLVGNTILQIANPTTILSVGRYVFGKAPMNTPTGKLLQEMIDAGGAPLQARFLNVQEKTNIAARAIKTMQGIESLSPKERAANLLAGLNRWIDGLADIMDMNARFATYRAATGLGIEPTDAARLALDSSLNLTRRGEMARSLDIALPFFGAGVESGRKTVRILTNPKALTKVFGSMIVLGVLESLWNAGQSGDDDEDGQENYLDQDRAGLRMNRLIIYHGSGADDYYKVPIDPMLGYFKFVGNRIGDVMAGTASPSESATGLVPGFISLMSPLRVPGTDVQSLAVAATPLMGKPFVENIMNQNFFGSPIYKERAFDNAPRSELGRETTGDFWKGLAKVINAAGGGSEAVSSPYGADFQPEVYRHIIESYFGGPYQLAKQMAGLKEAEGIADVPGIKSFVGSGSEYAPQSKYFENTTTVRQIMNRLSKLTPEQQARQGEKYFEDTDPRVMDAFKAVEANLDRINKEQKASMALAKSDEDRQVVLDYYRKQKNQYYSAFNSVYTATKRGE